MPGGDELENADQILGAVFDGRAGQGPASAAGDRAHDLARRAVAIFDPLRFIEHDQVEPHGRVGDDPPVADQKLVVGDFHRGVGQVPIASAAWPDPLR